MSDEVQEVEQKKPGRKNLGLIILGVIIILILVAGGFFIFRNMNNSSESKEALITPSPSQTSAQKIEATFVCTDDKNIIAIFNNDTDGSVDLALSGGTTMNLPRTESASGARYANSDETVVFWNSGNEAFLEENGEKTYTDCVAQPSS